EDDKDPRRETRGRHHLNLLAQVRGTVSFAPVPSVVKELFLANLSEPEMAEIALTCRTFSVTVNRPEHSREGGPGTVG
ncbi:MAG: hypothetical protein J4F98_09515, partial [Acidobacteria bacterium]|nr:hypothetical protein [Acidobacteriota bacterium]